MQVQSVDDAQASAAAPPTEAVRSWFGMVVPKRHAKRSVTRSLFKRQIRAAVGRHSATLADGLWVVRLRAPFDKALFHSAASVALNRAARAELDGLFAGVIRSEPRS